jgi:hypothetical protein
VAGIAEDVLGLPLLLVDVKAELGLEPDDGHTRFGGQPAAT